MSTLDQLNEIHKERRSLARAGRLHWFHWFIVALSLVLTLFVWDFSKEQLRDKMHTEFERETTQTMELITERMRKYEDALWSGVAAIQASGGEIGYEAWRIFSKNLTIDKKYPGISGIGVINYLRPQEVTDHINSQRLLRPDYDIHPKHNGNEFMPIVYIEPEAPNKLAVGLDMVHESGRYNAARKARDIGLAQITAPIFLVQDKHHTPGFLFYAPYYSGGNYDSIEERRQHFSGMVYAPFIVKKLMAGTLDKEKRRIGVKLSDGDNIIYNENIADEPDFDAEPLFKKVVKTEIYGRTWHFDMWTTIAFRTAFKSNQPMFILIGGLTVDALLLTLFLLLSRASRNTLTFADKVTQELKQKAIELEVSNTDLASFAYVASHDLKTPLRGIGDLTCYLEEDLEPYMTSPEANQDVKHNLQRLHKQTNRMNNLISGILEYSSVGFDKESISRIDFQSLMTDLRGQYKVRDDQLVFDGEFPVFDTYPLRFEQVISNLVSNAFKYHHDKEHAVVTISCKDQYDFLEFSVTDNGPGIDPRFHSRIFEVFQTLQPKDEIESTGVGLSIVKKTLEAMGGSITVSSKVGSGTCFRFHWPAQQLKVKHAS